MSDGGCCHTLAHCCFQDYAPSHYNDYYHVIINNNCALSITVYLYNDVYVEVCTFSCIVPKASSMLFCSVSVKSTYEMDFSGIYACKRTIMHDVICTTYQVWTVKSLKKKEHLLKYCWQLRTFKVILMYIVQFQGRCLVFQVFLVNLET